MGRIGKVGPKPLCNPWKRGGGQDSGGSGGTQPDRGWVFEVAKAAVKRNNSVKPVSLERNAPLYSSPIRDDVKKCLTQEKFAMLRRVLTGHSLLFKAYQNRSGLCDENSNRCRAEEEEDLNSS